MAKQGNLTCTFYVGGKPVDRLTPEQLDRMAQKIGETMSNYFSRHIDEYAKIKGEIISR